MLISIPIAFFIVSMGRYPSSILPVEAAKDNGSNEDDDILKKSKHIKYYE